MTVAVALPVGDHDRTLGRVGQSRRGGPGSGDPAQALLLLDRPLVAGEDRAGGAGPEPGIDRARHRLVFGFHGDDRVQDEAGIATVAGRSQAVTAGSSRRD
ncbi:hypothetical protein NS229_14520, partial [Methylobacterium indicum]